MPTLLIVDDVPANVRILASALEGMGRCLFATDGATAISLAQRMSPDIVLLDAEMPDMDGYQVCAALKENPATAHIPVIFVTAFNDVEHEMRALERGAVDFVVKPISPPVVRARVKAHLTLKSQADTLRRLADEEAEERRKAVAREADTAARLDATTRAVRAVVDASPQAMAILSAPHDEALTVGWANRQFSALFRRRLEEVLDRGVDELLPGAAWTDIRKTLGENRRWTGSLLVELPEGPAIDIELTFTPISQLGTIMITARDRTLDRRVARQESERLRLEALGRMAGRIAHEISNVLQPIMSHATLARHACAGNETACDHLADIQDAVRHGREIVRSVLAVAGGHAATRRPEALDVEVGKALELLAAAVPEAVSVNADLQPVGGQVELSPAELLQILGNLLANAVDATPVGGTIGVRTAVFDGGPDEAAALGLPEGQHAELVVSDSGGGMDAATLERAFDPFFTTKAIDKGSGLGLSTVRTVVESMGGKIHIASMPGRGTTVRVVVPLWKGPC